MVMPEGVFLVFFQHDDGRVVVFGGKLGDFSHAEFVAVAVGGAANVFGVGEHGGQDCGFFVEG